MGERIGSGHQEEVISMKASKDHTLVWGLVDQKGIIPGQGCWPLLHMAFTKTCHCAKPRN